MAERKRRIVFMNNLIMREAKREAAKKQRAALVKAEREAAEKQRAAQRIKTDNYKAQLKPLWQPPRYKIPILYRLARKVLRLLSGRSKYDWALRLRFYAALKQSALIHEEKCEIANYMCVVISSVGKWEDIDNLTYWLENPKSGLPQTEHRPL